MAQPGPARPPSRADVALTWKMTRAVFWGIECIMQGRKPFFIHLDDSVDCAELRRCCCYSGCCYCCCCGGGGGLEHPLANTTIPQDQTLPHSTPRYPTPPVPRPARRVAMSAGTVHAAPASLAERHEYPNVTRSSFINQRCHTISHRCPGRARVWRWLGWP